MKKKAAARGAAKRPSGKPKAAACIVIHDLPQALTALRAAESLGKAATLWSAPGAGIYAGAGWFAAVERKARAAVPAAKARFVLDCAERADMVQDAFRATISDVRFSGPAAIAGKLSDIAGKSGARLHRRRPNALDLACVNDPETVCLQYLSGELKTGR